LPSDAYLYWEYEGYPKDTWNLARIQDTVVSFKIRRKGYGTMLVKHAEERMRLYGVKEISGTATEIGEKFWPSQGYKLADKQIRKSLEVGIPVTKAAVTTIHECELMYSAVELRGMADALGIQTSGRSKRDLCQVLLQRGILK